MNPAVLAGTVAVVVSTVVLQKLIIDASALTRENIQVSNSILKSSRNEQWAAIEGLSEAAESAVTEARQIDAVTESVWEPIAGSLPEIQKQQKLTRREIRGHINAVKKLQGSAIRDYLTHNAESILFQVYAQLTVLKTYVQFQALRASIARVRSSQDAKEGELFEQITRETPAEFEKIKSEIQLLTNSLARELRIIAELPGRAAMPLSKKKQVKETQLTCQQLLDAIEPLADFLSPATEHPGKPPVSCGAGGLDLAPYLNIIRWFLEGEETVRAIALPYSVSSEGFGGGPARIRAIRVDRSWRSLSAEKVGSAVNKLATATAVAVSDRRIITGDPDGLLRRGELGPVYLLEDVRHVRGRNDQKRAGRPAIDIVTKHEDRKWMFPSSARHDDIDSLGALISEATHFTLEAPERGELEEDAPNNKKLANVVGELKLFG